MLTKTLTFLALVILGGIALGFGQAPTLPPFTPPASSDPAIIDLQGSRAQDEQNISNQAAYIAYMEYRLQVLEHKAGITPQPCPTGLNTGQFTVYFNALCKGVPPPDCSIPNTVGCPPPPPPSCNPPNTLVNGVCTPPTPPPATCTAYVTGCHVVTNQSGVTVRLLTVNGTPDANSQPAGVKGTIVTNQQVGSNGSPRVNVNFDSGPSGWVGISNLTLIP